jgi:hypothetical protein
MTANCVIWTLEYSNKIAPFLWGINSIIHYLTCSKFCFLLKYFLWSICSIDICVIYIFLTYDTKNIFSDPLPKSYRLFYFTLFDFGFCVKIENLKLKLINWNIYSPKTQFLFLMWLLEQLYFLICALRYPLPSWAFSLMQNFLLCQWLRSPKK